MLIYINGHFLDDHQSLIFTNDRGFLLGDGVFTTLKSINTQLLYFQDHFDRLKSNAASIHLPFNYTENALKTICNDVIRYNNLNNETIILRISLTRGKSQRGIDIPQTTTPTIVVSPTLLQSTAPKPIHLTFSRFKRNEYSPIIHIKTINYLESILARHEAQQMNYTDAILTNTKGAICETTAANIFFISDNRIVTPSISDGILPGITRNAVIKIAEILNIPIIQSTIFPNEIRSFKAAFLTNCVIGIQMVMQIEEHMFGDNSLTRLILDKYEASLFSSNHIS